MDRQARAQNPPSVDGALLTGAGYPYGDTASRSSESAMSRRISGISRYSSSSRYPNAVGLPPASRASSMT